MSQPRPARRPGAVPGAHRGSGSLSLAVLLTGLLAAGCSGAKADTGAAGPSPGRPAPASAPAAAPAGSCKAPPAADVPGAAGALSETDSGTFCLATGQQIDVFLTSPYGQKPGVTRWTAVASSAPDVLARRSSGILTAPVGVTPGIFQALAAGTVQLTSKVPGTDRTWHVSILIR